MNYEVFVCHQSILLDKVIWFHPHRMFLFHILENQNMLQKEVELYGTIQEYNLDLKRSPL